MSLDASRHLPTSAPPVSPASAQPAWHDPSSSLHSTKPPQDLSGREARQSFVQQLQAQEALQHWGEPFTPACHTLESLCWHMRSYHSTSEVVSEVHGVLLPECRMCLPTMPDRVCTLCAI